jgi:hypothetical protein
LFSARLARLPTLRHRTVIWKNATACASTVIVNGSKLPGVAQFPESEASAAYATGNNRFGAVTAVRVPAGQASNIAIW